MDEARRQPLCGCRRGSAGWGAGLVGREWRVGVAWMDSQKDGCVVGVLSSCVKALTYRPEVGRLRQSPLLLTLSGYNVFPVPAAPECCVRRCSGTGTYEGRHAGTSQTRVKPRYMGCWIFCGMLWDGKKKRTVCVGTCIVGPISRDVGRRTKSHEMTLGLLDDVANDVKATARIFACSPRDKATDDSIEGK